LLDENHKGIDSSRDKGKDQKDVEYEEEKVPKQQQKEEMR
jgi:hypothetical protein